LTGGVRSESLERVTLRSSIWGLAAILLACGCGGGVSPTGLGDGGPDGAGLAGAATSLKQGLVGAWSFDGDGNDHSPNKLDLDTRALRFVTGKFGKGIQFAGEGTQIAQRTRNDPQLDLGAGDFAVSFWVDFAMTGTAQFVAVKGYGSSGWFVGWARTAWAYGLPMGSTFMPPSSPKAGFHHVVFQRSGATMQLWVDASSLGTMPAMAGAASGDPFQVGGYAPGGVTADHAMSVVNGVVDDLAIWSRMLVTEEMAYLDTHPAP
jgi:hypothetical protein